MSKASRSMARFAVALAATVLMALAVSPVAFGASEVIEPYPGSVTLQAAAGKANHVTVTATSGGVTFTETGETITETLPNCSAGGPGTVTCTPTSGEFYGASVNLDALFPPGDTNNDSLTVNGSLRVSGSGGAGDDTFVVNATAGGELSGDAGSDVMTGGPGDDRLLGGAGVDTLTGNGGHDALQGGEGPGDVANGGPGGDVFLVSSADGTGDQLIGGPGLDMVLYLAISPLEAAIPITLDLGAGTASAPGTTASLSSIEDAVTDQGEDKVIGSPGANRIITALDEEPILGAISGIGGQIPIDAGDTVNPLGGPDYVSTGKGNDIVDIVDGFADRLDCGPGTDVVQADQLDELNDCEVVTRTTVGAPDTTKPSCKLKGIAASYSAEDFFDGLRAKVGCDEQVTLEARLTATAKARKGKRGKAKAARAGDLVLAEATGKLATSGSLKLKPVARLRSQLGSSFGAKLQIVARDSAGNAVVIKRSIRVKPDSGKPKKKK